MLTLKSPLASIPRYGTLYAKRCRQLGITTVRDLLLYAPYRYEDLSRVTPICDVRTGMTTTVKGRLLAITNRRAWRRHMVITEAVIQDATDAIKVIWFRQPFLTRVLKPGDTVWLAGTVSDEGYGLTLQNPVYEKVSGVAGPGSAGETLHTARIVPIYSTREKISQKQLRLLIHAVLPYAKQLDDPLSDGILRTHRLLPFAETIPELHFPRTESQLQRARRRMAFEELFFLQLKAAKARVDRGATRASRASFFESETRAFVASLPFQLTEDQRRAAWEIIQNMTTSDAPMYRLLEGDVGSGKTIVAAIALLNGALSGQQAFVMTPTAILAEQHFATFVKLFSRQPWSIGLLTNATKRIGTKGDVSECTRAEMKKVMADGRLPILVGTHALIADATLPKDRLALVVVDEQHRFGVEQRHALGGARPDGRQPHMLSMTATPIPRTLALTIFSDLDLSLLKVMPKNRKPIVTRVVHREQRADAYDAVRREVSSGRQVFVICPLIDPSDTVGVRSATEEYERLQKDVFPSMRLGLLHGRLKAADREKAMTAFRDGAVQVLVATSVVEVGVDVPNATVMMIEGSERFGLAQLHQFRGRVGRSEYQSFCYLMSTSDDAPALKRLEAVARSNDGFALAELDLKLRGPGRLYGVEQSGYMNLRFARLNDAALIKETRAAAAALLKDDPSLRDHPKLLERIADNSPVHPE